MIKELAKKYMENLDFPLDEQSELLDTIDVLLKTDDFLEILKRYEAVDFDFLSMIQDVKTLAESKELCVYTVHMSLLICMLPKMHERYISNNIDEKIFYDMARDLRYKLEECRLVHNKCGTFVASWYKRIFELNIFALGRLQFEINQINFDCEVDGVSIPKGTKVLSVHIPRTGTKLDHDLVIDSYKRAVEFFGDEFADKVIFMCSSWLLYPWMRSVLNDNANLAKFYDDYTIVSSGEYKDYTEIWRLFDCCYNGNPDDLPSDTSLRREYIARIKRQEPIGYGVGVFVLNK